MNATGYPSGGNGSGGFAQFFSSGSGNGFAENARVLFRGSHGAGRFVAADGTAAGAGGSTELRRAFRGLARNRSQPSGGTGC